MQHRAYSLLTAQEFDDGERTLKGIATTIETDRYGDIVRPKGAQFKLPIPFLWQHDAQKPIGHVTAAKVGEKQIDVEIKLVKPFEGAPQSWADRLDVAWADMKSGLVRGLSIGFNSLKHSYIDGTFGIDFEQWEWLELSGVTIAANAPSSIQTIKHVDSTVLRALQGRDTQRHAGVRLLHPSAEGSRKPNTRTASGAVLLIPPGGKSQ